MKMVETCLYSSMVFPLVLKDCLLFPKPLRDGWFEFTKDHLYPKAMSLTQNVHLEGCEVSGERLWPRGKELKEALGVLTVLLQTMISPPTESRGHKLAF